MRRQGENKMMWPFTSGEEPNPRLLGAKGDPIGKGSETIWEIVTKEDGFGFGIALVRIGSDWNEAHYHGRISEIYIPIWGEIETRLAYVTTRRNIPRWRGSSELGWPGHPISIRPRTAHRTRAETDYAWFYVFSFPPFNEDDYHVVPVPINQ